MKKIAGVIILVMMASFLPSYALAENEYIYVSVKDTSVRKNLPEANYGGDNTAEASNVTDATKCIAYYSFDISSFAHDNAAVLETPNSQLGFWYEADLTAALNKKYQAGITAIDMQVLPTNIDNSNINGRFYTREAEFNKPHLKVKFSADKKSIESAKLYLFGATSSYRVEIYSLLSAYSEMEVTYSTRPFVDERLGYAYRNAALSGRPESDVIETVDGHTYEQAMSTTLKSFENAFPDYVKWNELFDAGNIPSVDELLADFESNPRAQEHPRILGGRDDWENVRRWYREGNEYVVKWAEALLNSADKAAAQEVPYEFTYNGSDMEYRGGDIPTLGMAYQLTLDKKYSDAAYRNMERMAGYTHWNDSVKDLNVGDCAKNVGTGFDLVYDALSEDQRKVVANAVIRHVIDKRLGRPNNNTNNWNPVTNGGFGIGAAAIMNEYPRQAAEMIAQSIAAMPQSFVEYYPDGGFPEGQAYWEYMTLNLFGFVAALDQTFGKTYGLIDFKGLSQTGYFPVYMLGPTKDIRFKYGDDNLKNVGSSIYFYLAKCYDNPDFAQYQLEYIKNNNAYITLAPYWCSEDTWSADGMYDRLPADKLFDGFTPVATLRSAWEDKNALFAGIKGGYAQTSHSDLDIGTFIVAALGVEWSKELYPRISSRTGFPSQSRMTRYMFYASSPQGNNTVIFNPGQLYPDMDYGQAIDTYTTFDELYSDDNCSYAILNMSDAYRKYNSSTRRGIALINNKREFLLQDEIESNSKNLMYWFMHTDAEIETDGNTALLRVGDKRLYMKILSPAKAEFEVMAAKALPRTPTISDFDEDKFGREKKLVIKTELTGRQQLAVWMVPLTEHDPIPTGEPEVRSLDCWPLPETAAARLEGVTLNGEAIADFSPEKLVYDINVTDDNFNIEGFGENVTVEKTVYDGAVILKVSETGKKPVRYVFNRAVNANSGITCIASDIPQPENSPENTLDGDLTTRWASQHEQNIVYDLGEAAALNSVSVAFYQGGERIYNFKIEISADGVNYQTVFDGKSSGIMEELETHEFAATEARFVRISLNENNVNSWNNLSEVAFGYAAKEKDKLQEHD